MNFEERLEFNEGDVGLAGGVQIVEPAAAHIVTVDSIRRFGGSSAPTMPWPDEEDSMEDRRNRKPENGLGGGVSKTCFCSSSF